MIFLGQLVDVGINVGSRYAQSILEMLVRNLSSCLELHMLHSGEELLNKHVLPNKAHIFKAWRRRLGNASSEM
jgi:hypothetical protein